MSETWLPFATKKPGPPQKAGYGALQKRVVQGFVGHSMEGSLAAALGELMNPNRQASWTLSNPKVGPLLQHYPLEAITWASGSQEANRRFLAMESEGVAGELLNPNQIANVQAVLNAIPLVWERKVTLWEHKEMVAFGSAPTACPSNRYPWAQILAGLEDDVTKQECIDAMKEVLTDPAAFGELQGKSVIQQLQASDNWILTQIGAALDKAAEDLKAK